EDSIGYYGLRARREVGLPPLTIRAAQVPPPAPAVAAALGRIDTLILAGLDSAADDEVRAVLAHPPQDLDALLAWSAGLAARGLDVTFDPGWITLPDYNLHLGAAHLAELLRRFGGRVEVAAAAYNAGAAPVGRWLTRPGADDPDQFIELVPYPETRGYIRAV